MLAKVARHATVLLPLHPHRAVEAGYALVMNRRRRRQEQHLEAARATTLAEVEVLAVQKVRLVHAADTREDVGAHGHERARDRVDAHRLCRQRLGGHVDAFEAHAAPSEAIQAADLDEARRRRRLAAPAAALLAAVGVEDQPAGNPGVGTRLERLQHPLEGVGADDAVGVEQDENGRAGRTSADVHAGGEAEIARIDDDPEARVVAGALAQLRETVVARGVVDDDQLHRSVRAQHRAGAIEQKAPGVVVDDDDRDAGRFRHGTAHRATPGREPCGGAAAQATSGGGAESGAVAAAPRALRAGRRIWLARSPPPARAA